MQTIFNNGSYVIVFYLHKKIKIFIPRFNITFYECGYYVYSGSAKKNLISRVTRHLKKSKKIRWHIDFFTTQTKVEAIEVFLFQDKSECEVNHLLKDIGGKIIIPGFGASDCKNKCISHFLYFKKLPNLKKIVNFGGINARLYFLQNNK